MPKLRPINLRLRPYLPRCDRLPGPGPGSIASGEYCGLRTCQHQRSRASYPGPADGFTRENVSAAGVAEARKLARFSFLRFEFSPSNQVGTLGSASSRLTSSRTGMRIRGSTLFGM